MTYKVKDGISLMAHVDAVHSSLHYTAQGSSDSKDMVLRTTPMVDQRQERVPGFRTKYLNGDVPPEQVARISSTLGLPDGSGYVQLASADPSVQPTFNYRYLQHPNDRRRVREGLRLAEGLMDSCESVAMGLKHLIQERWLGLTAALSPACKLNHTRMAAIEAALQRLAEAQLCTEGELHWLANWQCGESGRRDDECDERETRRRALASFNSGEGEASDQRWVQQWLMAQGGSHVVWGGLAPEQDPPLSNLLWSQEKQLAMGGISLQING
jgi:hypothetical protein